MPPVSPTAQATPPEIHHPERAELDLREVLCAIAEPNRLRVVAMLVNQPRDSAFPYPWFELPVGKAGRTHHFRVLRESGVIFVAQRPNGTEVRLRWDDLEARFPGLLSAIHAGAAVTPPPRDGSDE
ncbi:helix-turn-helix transcriptional regulator [Spiractinospora alimapuensis]|uniref:ArsR/SmtB family transcription factor n=1 Tax=Spiractinospora alimapuensis TaxID=2820884 RepID=UPI001F46C215|nr:helix-turn-helix transcriptional regulator [Spiractinospora alimapuensis]QVQ50010.1 helix-turn-helix transcriptional regulator [Spiractinospora alimapuensis]